MLLRLCFKNDRCFRKLFIDQPRPGGHAGRLPDETFIRRRFGADDEVIAFLDQVDAAVSLITLLDAFPRDADMGTFRSQEVFRHPVAVHDDLKLLGRPHAVDPVRKGRPLYAVSAELPVAVDSVCPEETDTAGHSRTVLFIRAISPPT